MSEEIIPITLSRWPMTCCQGTEFGVVHLDWLPTKAKMPSFKLCVIKQILFFMQRGL